jgi:hypothetical protein
MRVLRTVSSEPGSSKFNGKAYAESLHWIGPKEPEELPPPVITFWHQEHMSDHGMYSVIYDVQLTRWLLNYPQNNQFTLLRDAIDGMNTEHPLLVPMSAKLMRSIVPVTVWHSLRKLSTDKVGFKVRFKPEIFYVVRE